MFRFEQKPNESGSDLRKRFLIELILYSFMKYKSQKKAAKFLGLSVRGLYELVRRYKELEHLKKLHPNCLKCEAYHMKRRLYDYERK